MKKTFCSLCAILLCFIILSPAMAVGTVSVISELDFVTQNIEELLPSLLYDEHFGVTVDNFDNIYIGSPISSYSYENEHWSDCFLQYPIYQISESENQIIGLCRIITHSNGERTVDYGIDCANELQVFLEKNNNPAIALLYYEDHVSVKTNSSEVVLQTYVTNYSSISTVSIPDYLSLNTSTVIKKISTPISTFGLNANEGHTLDIDVVLQGNYGICWAAGVACVTNYYYDYSLDALDVAEYASALGYIYWDPDINDYNRGLYDDECVELLNEYDIGTDHKTIYFTYSTLKNHINNDRLIYIFGDRYDSSGDVVAGHVVIGYGYSSTTSGGKSMYYMEPNTGRRVATFPSSGPIIFTSTSNLQYETDGYVVCSES